MAPGGQTGTRVPIPLRIGDEIQMAMYEPKIDAEAIHYRVYPIW
tara:strand:+ start:17679 stop:17810 length:132 start_codon:yes stop_codon:yes gene_type:complete